MKLPRPLRAVGTFLLGRITGRKAVAGAQVQTAALPWRCNPDGELEILLVTGRHSSRWLVPRGWPMRGKSLAEAAAQEAYEEAGIEGRIEPEAIGQFPREKQHPLLGALPVSIPVFPLEVERELPEWPERAERRRRWFSPAEAAAAVSSPELASLIDRFAAVWQAR